MQKLGVWLVGARGGVATTALLGLAALRRGLAQPWGMASELPEFRGAGLVDLSRIVIGGHEIRPTSILAQARELAGSSRAFDRQLVETCAEDLEAMDAEIRPGTVFGSGSTIENLAAPDHLLASRNPAEIVSLLREDWKQFRRRHGLERMIVVNVASTEPPLDLSSLPETWSELEMQLGRPGFRLPASVIYAIAAIGDRIPHINFTPSPGSSLPAVRELALREGVCHAGRDGKTGETLLKSVLAPMFAHRNLEIMSWVGHNIIGNMDGQVLDDPDNKAAKISSKDRLLRELLGYSPQTHVSIEFIRSLGDWKTAWDHIHFRGFLGTPMMLQFTWQGCDSILAAPLVLDLIRFTDWAARRGESGELGWLACFFKSPQGSGDHDFSRQFAALCSHVNGGPPAPDNPPDSSLPTVISGGLRD